MFTLFARHWVLILVWGIILGAAACAVTFLFPQYYSAETKVLIISRDRSGVDPYTQAKSAERIGENLAALMSTTDFYNKTMENAPASGVDVSVWQGLSERDQRKNWEKQVVGGVVYGQSLLDILVYDRTPAKAAALSDAVTKTMVARGAEYVGGDVSIKQVDSALVSRFPARPNALLNGAAGLAVGVLLAAWWVIRYKHNGLFYKA